MRIKHIHVQRLQTPLKLRFAQSNNATNLSDSTIIIIETENGIKGCGESCPRPYVTGEDFTSVKKDLATIKAQLKTKSFNTIEDITHLICQELPGKIGLAAICGLELALLDAWSQECDTPIYDLIFNIQYPISNVQCPVPSIQHPASEHHNITTSIPYSGVIPFGKIEKFKPILDRFQFKKIKVKVSNDLKENINRITALKDYYGPQTPIRVDVNGAWTYPEALRQIPALIKIGVHSFEQVFQPGMEKEMAAITRLYGNEVLIMTDESICSYADAKYLIENNCCNAFNLKISKNGGILNTLRIYQLASKHGISCQLGAHFGETSLLTAAGIIFSSFASKLIAHEGGLGTVLLENDLCENPIQIDQNGEITPASVLNTIGLLQNKIAKYLLSFAK